MTTMRIKFLVENNFPSLVCLWRKLKGLCMRSAPMEEVFTEIYQRNSWGEEESRSGVASSLAHTRAIRAQLPDLIKELGARFMLDIPCGDFHWMKEVPLDLDCYIGADVVQELIESNRRFANDVRKFVTLDITSDPLPKVDLILCRDCLIHFSFDDIFRAIDNIKASRSQYLLTTTFSRVKRNSNIITGQWRPLNLQRLPFDFPSPLSIIREEFTVDGDRYSDKSLALWRIADL